MIYAQLAAAAGGEIETRAFANAIKAARRLRRGRPDPVNTTCPTFNLDRPAFAPRLRKRETNASLPTTVGAPDQDWPDQDRPDQDWMGRQCTLKECRTRIRSVVRGTLGNARHDLLPRGAAD